MIRYGFESKREEKRFFKNKFWEGFGSVLNIGGYGFKAEYKKNDTEAIRSDWEAVGNYFTKAMSNLEKKL